MKKLFAWIDRLVNRLATNVTLWIVAAVVVLVIVAYTAYSTIFIRLPEPPVYASYEVLGPQRQPCVVKPTAYPQSQAPQPTPSPQGQTPQATPSPEGQAPQATPSPESQAPQATPYPQGELPPCPEIKVPLDEWTPEQRERYYQTSQGSLVIPYAWFRSLESRTSNEMFSAPEVQARYGLLPNNNPTYNKDLMPVGIVKNIVADQYVHLLGDDQKEWASISCAACHTGQLTYRGHAMRIDGGQSFWNFDKWSGDLVFSLMLTSTLPERFERFCSRVYQLPGSARCTPESKKQLRQQIERYLNSDLVINAINAILQHTYPSTESFTRTSALGRGVNGIFGPIDKCPGPFSRNCERNVDVNTGPVSFPPLWYTHEYDWVQSTTQIRQPLGRNVTESWGVSVHVELRPETGKQFASTHNIDDMFWMETLLSILQAPKWPEHIFSEIGEKGKINQARVKRGSYLYNEAVWSNALPAEKAELPANKDANILGPNKDRPTKGYCARCHAPAFEPDNAWPTTESTYTPQAATAAGKLYDQKFLQLPLYRQEVMDTDPDDAKQFAERLVHTTYLQPLFKDVRPPDKPELVGIGTALSKTISGILEYWFKENGISGDCQQIMQGHRQNLFRAPIGYPARPLDGYWATGPFLHNGSVRTMYELLSPVSERAETFWIGSREFDPIHLGFENDNVEGAFLYDTSLRGNSNRGHEFQNAAPGTKGVIGPYLSPEDRLAIIEYLKVMRSVQEFLDANPRTANRLDQRNALLKAMSNFYEKNEQSIQTPYGVAVWVEPGNRPQSEGGFDRAKFCQAIVEAVSVPSYGPPAPATSPTP